EALKLGQKVQVKVLEVDKQRKRIALSIKQTLAPAQTAAPKSSRPHTSQKSSTHAPQDLSNLPVGDALALLKQKFGK
ncbi:MAG: S1 RNA-binding domain-containing protein, partial [Sphingobacteriia bacterium]